VYVPVSIAFNAAMAAAAASSESALALAGLEAQPESVRTKTAIAKK
jgi:hypothetical protein